MEIKKEKKLAASPISKGRDGVSAAKQGPALGGRLSHESHADVEIVPGAQPPLTNR